MKLNIDVGIGAVELPGDGKKDVDVEPGKRKQVTLPGPDQQQERRHARPEPPGRRGTGGGDPCHVMSSSRESSSPASSSPSRASPTRATRAVGGTHRGSRSSVVTGGLCLAGAVAFLAHGIRRRRLRQRGAGDIRVAGRERSTGGCRALHSCTQPAMPCDPPCDAVRRSALNRPDPRCSGAEVSGPLAAPRAQGRVDGEDRGTREDQGQPGHQVGEVVAVVVRVGGPAHRQPQAEGDERAAEGREAGQQADERADADGQFAEGDGVAKADGALRRGRRGPGSQRSRARCASARRSSRSRSRRGRRCW